MPGDLKEQYLAKIEWGVIYVLALGERSLKIWILVILKNFLRIWRTHNGEKRKKTEHISVNNGPTFKNF